MIKKPMLADDVDLSKLKYPVIVMPKIDGVRGMYVNIDSGLTGRSFKAHKNKFTTKRLSDKRYYGFDGELIAGTEENADDLCRATTSAVNTIEGQPHVSWLLFDYVREETLHLGYKDRLMVLQAYIETCHISDSIRVVQWYEVSNEEDLLKAENFYISEGYEGIIIRDPSGLYKEGRSTAKEGGYLRLKRFSDAEATVIGITEGFSNNNEATLSPTGYTERSSHQENLSPNGMIGNLICKCPQWDEPITIAPGKMNHSERIHYFKNQHEIIGKVVKYKHFSHGVKDKPRFPTFQSFRAETDL